MIFVTIVILLLLDSFVLSKCKTFRIFAEQSHKDHKDHGDFFGKLADFWPNQPCFSLNTKVWMLKKRDYLNIC